MKGVRYSAGVVVIGWHINPSAQHPGFKAWYILNEQLSCSWSPVWSVCLSENQTNTENRPSEALCNWSFYDQCISATALQRNGPGSRNILAKGFLQIDDNMKPSTRQPLFRATWLLNKPCLESGQDLWKSSVFKASKLLSDACGALPSEFLNW